jgi:pyridoxine kinase
VSILSIQSLVAYGHAGNSAALFPLQRLGKVVWPVMTVHFSNHTGYGDWKGPLLTSADIAEVIEGVEARGALERCEAVLSGYQGAEDVGAVILDAVAKVKAASPDALYCCDPVMGDVGRGMFVRPGIPEFMRDQVVPAADVITPNHYELDFLAGTTTAECRRVGGVSPRPAQGAFLGSHRLQVRQGQRQRAVRRQDEGGGRAVPARHGFHR